MIYINNIKEKCIKLVVTGIVFMITIKLLTDVIFGSYITLSITKKDLDKIITFPGEKIYICGPAQGTRPSWIVVGNGKGLYDNQLDPKKYANETSLVQIDNFNIELFLLSINNRDNMNRVQTLFGNTIVIVARNKGKRLYRVSKIKSDNEEYTVLKATRIYILNKN